MRLRLLLVLVSAIALACSEPAPPDGDGGVLPDGGDAGRLPPGADGGVDGGPLVSCDGIALETDTTLDLDLEARRGSPGGLPLVTVSGAVTLNGAPFPDAGVRSGAIRFVGASGGGMGTIESGRYSVELPAGRYQVNYARLFCVEGGGPCTSGQLMAETVVGDGGATLDLDVPSVSVSGRVTLDGVGFPEGERGSVGSP